MKILIVHPQMSLYGGAEVVIVRLANYLQEYGHYVSILTLCVKDRVEYSGLTFILPDKTKDRIEYRLRGSFDTLAEVYHMYRALQNLCAMHVDVFDVINVHNFPAIWSVPQDKKVIWMCNEIPDLYHNHHISKFINPLLNIGRYGDRLITRTKHAVAVVADTRMAKIFEHRYNFKPTIIPYGIDYEFFSAAETHVQTALWKKFIVIHPAIISPSKQQLKVLEAINVLRYDIPNIRVIFVGKYEHDDKYMQVLLKYIEQQGLEPYVRFTNNVDKAILLKLYSAAHVAIFPGRGQGSWLGPFEALAAGKPIIVSPNLTCSELIREKNLGIVSDDLVTSIKTLERNSAQLTEAREFVKNELTWDKFCDKFTELL